MASDPRTPDAEPVIIDAVLAAGHDGAAEAVVNIRYPNGAERAVTFNCDALATALDAAGITSLDGLVGRPWTVLVGRARVSENANPQTSTIPLPGET